MPLSKGLPFTARERDLLKEHLIEGLASRRLGGWQQRGHKQGSCAGTRASAAVQAVIHRSTSMCSRTLSDNHIAGRGVKNKEAAKQGSEITLASISAI